MNACRPNLDVRMPSLLSDQTDLIGFSFMMVGAKVTIGLSAIPEFQGRASYAS
jgi:hypothetical protein